MPEKRYIAFSLEVLKGIAIPEHVMDITVAALHHYQLFLVQIQLKRNCSIEISVAGSI